MEGKAKAEQDSLTQVEEEDTSVQAYCADSCRQRMRADKAIVHWASEKKSREAPDSPNIKHQKAQRSDPNWLKLRPVSCTKSTICSRIGYPD